MAIDEVDQSDSGHLDGEDDGGGSDADQARVGEYTWREFMHEHGYSDDVPALYEGVDGSGGLLGGSGGTPSGAAWDRVDFRPEQYLDTHPDDLGDWITEVPASRAETLYETVDHLLDPEKTPVYKDTYTWEHYKREYYYDSDGNPPGGTDDFDPEEHLGFHPENTEGVVANAGGIGEHLADLVDERTVDVNEDLDEDAFFETDDGHTTVVNRYDLEKAVPFGKKTHFVEEERYWVNKPYSFVIVFHSQKENEKKYYAIEPYLNEIESDLQEFLTGKLRTAIKYSDENVAVEEAVERETVIEEETDRLLKRYDLLADADAPGFLQQLLGMFGGGDREETEGELDGIETRPEPAVLEDDADVLSEYQVEKLLYYLKRDFIGFERIDPIKHDINVEDISCDGYDSPVFVYHSGYEQIISNIYHGNDELDDFVVKLAQRSGKGISKRQPQVDATLPDGSRAQLTLGDEVSDHGTNYTIRQFKDVPHTPIDLINWKTFSLDEMAFLWLCIENNKSLIFAGGTASGKTTSLNAVSLFIPSNAKIVSIEDTREVELPQRNWIASVTRPSFTDDDKGDVDEFDLLEAALRQRPEYIVMGEVRGEEGRDLFQVMSTGHTSYSTFHADTVGEVLKRFTTDPINVSKTMFTALDLVSIQTSTRVQGHKVRRNNNITEINHYDAENDEINVQDVYQWQPETDEFLRMGDSNTLEEIKFDRGWNQQRLEEELFKRRVILAYLIKNGLNTYTEVAATIQAFINDPPTILTLVANGTLERSLEDLREMESVLIDIDPEKEDQVPRPDPNDEGMREANNLLENAEESLFEEYRGRTVEGLASALETDVDDSPPLEDLVDDEPVEFSGELDEEALGEAGIEGPGIEAPDASGAEGATAGGDAGATASGDGAAADDGADAAGDDAPSSLLDEAADDGLFSGGSEGGFTIDDDAPNWLHDEGNGDEEGGDGTGAAGSGNGAGDDSHADWAEDAVPFDADDEPDEPSGFGGFEEATVEDGEEETS